jgi:AcrR family transcriptional regulator
MPKIKTSKEEVLKKIIPVLRSRGVHNSSMSELSKACGIQKSHFYYYFNSKEELIKEVLATVLSYFKYNLSKVTQSDNTISEKVIHLKALVNKLFTTFDGGCIMANTALETIHLNPVYKKEIQLFFQNFISELQHLLEVHHSKEESLMLAEQIVQDIEGGILLMQVYNDPKYFNNAIARMEKTILNQ